MLGVYISVPFCRSKCTYCNFASGVHSPALYQQYVDLLCSEITRVRRHAGEWGVEVPERVDSVYLGGGTPSLLPPHLLLQLGRALRGEFNVLKTAEITLECAPGQLSGQALEAMLEIGVNRVSFGVQSFVDREAAAAGRLHTRVTALSEIRRVRGSGIRRVNVDLIAGLPFQTAASWQESLDTLMEAEADHASIYMLEIDEESRLGREMLAGGARYHAAAAPSEEQTADFYVSAVVQLERTGLRQYEISNFAREGSESRHNCRYWRRQPYLGFGVDAHSFLRRPAAGALRLASAPSLEEYLAGSASPGERTELTPEQELEEAWFLGLRLREGVRWSSLAERYGGEAKGGSRRAGQGQRRTPRLQPFLPVVAELQRLGLLVCQGDAVRLTRRGILLSNEVFARFLGVAEASTIAC